MSGYSRIQCCIAFALVVNFLREIVRGIFGGERLAPGGSNDKSYRLIVILPGDGGYVIKCIVPKPDLHSLQQNSVAGSFCNKTPAL